MQARALLSVLVVTFVPMFMGASCQSKDTISKVRQAHVVVRDAFVKADGFIAEEFERAGDQCIMESGTALESDGCMRVWLRLEEVLVMSREALAALETVYDSIEAGSAGVNEWQYWALQVVAHGRAVLRILDELNMETAGPVIKYMRNSIDNVCGIIQCEGST